MDDRQRLFLLYLKGRCEPCGVFQLHFPVDSAYLGFTLDRKFIKDFLAVVNAGKTRIEALEGQKLWLKGFVRYQQIGPKRDCLSKESPPHKSIVKGLKEHGIYQQAVDEDSVLFQEYTSEVVENNEPPPEGLNSDNKGNARVGQGLPKGYSNSPGNSSGNSNDAHFILEIKKTIPGHVLINVGELAFQGDLERVIEQLKSHRVKEPEKYLMNLVEKTDWQKNRWEDFIETLSNGADVPF